jgi:plastocyanin
MKRLCAAALIWVGSGAAWADEAAKATSAPGSAAAPASTSAAEASGATAPASVDPVGERAAALREAAGLLDKAKAARQSGNRNFADLLFSSAEVLVGPEALADLAQLFREGAPPRVSTPLRQLPKDSPPQPLIIGEVDDEPLPEEKPKRGTLSGTLALEGRAFDGRGVVTLEPVGAKWRRREPRQRVMEQRNREFAPKFMTIPIGSTVTFPNFDNVYHNVFSRSDARAFDLGIYKGGQARDLVFEKEGIVRVGCNLHANMSAYIVVINAPRYAVTDSKGRFSFKSLEPGKYKVRAFSEKSQTPVTKELTIAPDKNTVSMTLPVDAPVTIDKFGVVSGGR